jgi:hypothetical protein
MRFRCQYSFRGQPIDRSGLYRPENAAVWAVRRSIWRTQLVVSSRSFLGLAFAQAALVLELGFGLPHARLRQRVEQPPKKTSPVPRALNLGLVGTASLAMSLFGLGRRDGL